MNKFELLMPAGNYEKGVYSIEYGADAIYIGPKFYSLRARSVNFDFDEITKMVEYAHSKNKKVYVVLNIICHNHHMAGFKSFFNEINKTNVDAAIVADPFIFDQIKKINPNFEVHISTQQSVCNSKAAMFWKDNGATRVVLGRETSFDELKQLCQNINNQIEIEYFIHGAVCISYSGRCMMSNNFSLRDANVGGCAQSCRWSYDVLNYNTDNRFFTMSAKDMSLINGLKQLMTLNISSFKIEGRMKSLHYVSTIAACYRKVIDAINNNEEIDMKQIDNEITKAENRPTNNAWFDGNPNFNKMLYHEENRELNQIFAFIFIDKIDDNKYLILSKNHFDINDSFELVSPNLENISFKIKTIFDQTNKIDVVQTPMKEYIVEIDKNINEWKNRIVRKV